MFAAAPILPAFTPEQRKLIRDGELRREQEKLRLECARAARGDIELAKLIYEYVKSGSD